MSIILDIEKYAQFITLLTAMWIFYPHNVYNNLMSKIYQDTTTIWNLLKNSLKNEISSYDYKIWINKNTKLAKLSDTKATFYVKNQFAKKWLLTNIELIQRTFKDIQNISPQIEVIEKPSAFADNTNTDIQLKGTILDPEIRQKNILETALKNANLDPRYVFEAFIVGPSNQLAYASAVAVSEDPGRAYNPLFIYGPVGTGKTHLLQAIGHKVLQKNPKAKVLYMTSEDFLNDLVTAIGNNKTQSFKAKYRHVDLLIIDDIQFVSGWPTTQEELFHTFNTLYHANKQIIFASDRPPSEIEDIAERLRSRFQGGMVVDIMPPDYETKIAILTKINAQNNNIVSAPALSIIAENVGYNIRQLIGAYNKIANYAKVLHKNISTQDVYTILKKDFNKQMQNKTSAKPEDILKKVAETFSVDLAKILSSSRDANTALARQVAMYILRQELKLTLKDTAYTLRRKDHTTVLHAVNKISQLMEKDKELKNKIMALSVELRG